MYVNIDHVTHTHTQGEEENKEKRERDITHSTVINNTSLHQAKNKQHPVLHNYQWHAYQHFPFQSLIDKILCFQFLMSSYLI